MYECLACVYEHHVCAALGGQKRDLYAPTRVNRYESLYGGETNQGPMPGQQVLLTAKPSLQPNIFEI